MKIRKTVKIGALGVLFIAIVSIFLFFDPDKNAIFPQCPFLLLTGYRCPGCGAQRAFHELLHLRAGEAFRENALFVMLIPYTMLGIYLEYFGGKERFPKLLAFFFGKQAIIVLLVFIFAFWAGRNIV